jgi:hypothetical protein
MANVPLPGIAAGPPTPSPIVNACAHFSIAREDADILRQHLDEFQNADTDSRANVIQRAMAEVYQRHPPNTSFDKMEAGEVFSAPVSLQCPLFLFNAIENTKVVL